MILFASKDKKEDKDAPKDVIDNKEILTDDLLLSTNNESSVDLVKVCFGGYDTDSERVQPERGEDASEPKNWFFDFGRVTMLNNTTIYFNCLVGKETVDDAIRLLKRVNQNIASIEIDYPELKGKLKPKFVINSNGGAVVEGFRLFDAIKNNMYPVNTVVNGMAASMGIIILVAGAIVQATPHSVLMIHQLSAGAQGKFSELQGHMKFWTDLQSNLANILIENSKAKKEDIEKFMKGETYIMAEDALKLGLIDSIVNI